MGHRMGGVALYLLYRSAWHSYHSYSYHRSQKQKPEARSHKREATRGPNVASPGTNEEYPV
jgi:hypothetical protein